MKDWEIIADNLKKAGWSVGWSQLWIGKGKRSGLWTRMATESVVRADEKLTAFGTGSGDTPPLLKQGTSNLAALHVSSSNEH